MLVSSITSSSQSKKKNIIDSSLLAVASIDNTGFDIGSYP